jgi:hypothetical protein
MKKVKDPFNKPEMLASEATAKTIFNDTHEKLKSKEKVELTFENTYIKYIAVSFFKKNFYFVEDNGGHEVFVTNPNVIKKF